MPSSRASTIPVVIHLLRQLRPQSILDVGVGFGKWGHLFREYTDINEAERDPRRYQREHWQVRIDGIEGHAAYLTDMHRFLYNEIHVGDAARVLPTLGHYDLIFLGDIIEHFEKAAGKQLLQDAWAHAHKAVVVSTPKFETDQEDLCGNELERHRSLWSARDFRAWPGAQVKTIGGDTLIALLPRAGLQNISFTPARAASDDSRQRMRAARTELLQLIRADEEFVLIDEEQLRPLLPYSGARPFIEREGVYWGAPADSAVAVTELERLRSLGCNKVVFLWSTFWWLDHYTGLREHLQAGWNVTHDSANVRVYEPGSR